LPWAGRADAPLRELAALQDVRDRAELEKRLRRLLKAAEGRDAPDTRLAVLDGALSLAPRVGEAFTAELLGQLVPSLGEPKGDAGLEAVRQQAALLEHGLRLGADLGRRELVKDLSARSGDWIGKRLAEGRADLAGGVAAEALRGLRKVGLRERV